MISADSSVMVAYFQGENSADTKLVEQLIIDRRLILSPIVVAEILSNPHLSPVFVKDITSFPTFEIDGYFWRRLGFMRSKLIEKKLKARLADSAIAQVCIDNNVELIVRDVDFRHFEKYCGLKIIKFKK